MSCIAQSGHQAYVDSRHCNVRRSPSPAQRNPYRSGLDPDYSSYLPRPIAQKYSAMEHERYDQQHVHHSRPQSSSRSLPAEQLRLSHQQDATHARQPSATAVYAIAPADRSHGRTVQTAHRRHRRGPWSHDEDTRLLALVTEDSQTNWVSVSATLGTRTPKQCRERYHQNLKPGIDHRPISKEEGELIESLVREKGRKWADIARALVARSDNAVKNWWNGNENRKKRHSRRRQDTAPAESAHTNDYYHNQPQSWSPPSPAYSPIAHHLPPIFPQASSRHAHAAPSPSTPSQYAHRILPAGQLPLPEMPSRRLYTDYPPTQHLVRPHGHEARQQYAQQAYQPAVYATQYTAPPPLPHYQSAYESVSPRTHQAGIQLPPLSTVTAEQNSMSPTGSFRTLRASTPALTTNESSPSPRGISDPATPVDMHYNNSRRGSAYFLATASDASSQQGVQQGVENKFEPQALPSIRDALPESAFNN